MAYEQYTAPTIALFSDAYAQGEGIIGTTGMTALTLAVGIALYAILVGTFYTKLSKKVLHEVNIRDHLGNLEGPFQVVAEIVSFVLHYTLVFPLISFLWFVVLSVLLYLLSGTLTLDNVFLLAVSVVAAIRISAYYNEDIAVDVAKLLPLALLGVLLVDPTHFTADTVQIRLEQLFAAIPQFLPFLGLVIGMEWTLRILLLLKRAFIPKKKKQETGEK